MGVISADPVQRPELSPSPDFISHLFITHPPRNMDDVFMSTALGASKGQGMRQPKKITDALAKWKKHFITDDDPEGSAWGRNDACVQGDGCKHPSHLPSSDPPAYPGFSQNHREGTSVGHLVQPPCRRKNRKKPSQDMP